jgi:cell division transport system permease protein
MAFSRIKYFSKSGVQLIRQNMVINLMAVGTITLSFLIFSVFFLIYENLNSFLNVWEKRIQIIAYIDDGLSDQGIEEIRGRIASLPQVEEIHFVSRDAAMVILKKHLRDQDRLLEGLRSDILPASFEIQVKRAHRKPVEIRQMISTIKTMNGISDIQYGQQWIDRFSALMELYRFSALLLGLLLAAAIAFIVSNAIRLSIYSRREELEVMKLVGATPAFIKIPFYVEGSLQGVIGSAVSLVILLGLYLFFLSELTHRLRLYGLFIDIRFLEPGDVFLIIVGGGLLGFLGSFLSLTHLKEN